MRLAPHGNRTNRIPWVCLCARHTSSFHRGATLFGGELVTPHIARCRADGIRSGVSRDELKPVPRGSSSTRAVADGPEHGQDVLDGRVALDVVDGVEDEAAVRFEDRRCVRGPRDTPRRACRTRWSAACPRRRPRRRCRCRTPASACAASISAAEHCTGLRMSKPASMKSRDQIGTPSRRSG